MRNTIRLHLFTRLDQYPMERGKPSLTPGTAIIVCPFQRKIATLLPSLHLGADIVTRRLHKDTLLQVMPIQDDMMKLLQIYQTKPNV